MSTVFHTGPVPGRILWGHPTKPQQKTDQRSKQPIIKADGSPAQQWVFGVGFPKQAFEQYIYPHLYNEALTGYPNGTPPAFSWKYKDGDGIDSKGGRYADREGYAGHYVMTVSTEAFAPPVFRRDPVTGGWLQLQPEEIKPGDFIALEIDAKVNVPTNPQHTPGLYINPKAIEFVGYGTEIVQKTAVDPNQAFGNMQYQAPAGMSTTPIVSQGGIGMPGTQAPPPMAMPQPGMPGQVPMQQPMMPAAQPQMMPGNVQPAAPGYPVAGSPVPGNVQPAPDFVHGAQPAMPQPGVMPTPSPAPMLGQPMMPQPGVNPGMPPMPGR